MKEEMLMFRPKTDVQRLREFFVQIKGKYPEDYIEVEEAIQLFARYEQGLIHERDAFRKGWEDSFKYAVAKPFWVREEDIDPAALAGNGINYNTMYDLQKAQVPINGVSTV